jgi:hypothetical protein
MLVDIVLTYHMLAKVAQVEKTKAKETSEIKTMGRPKGEAGSKRKGFNLQEAMGLKDNNILYNSIMVSPKEALLMETDGHWCFMWDTSLFLAFSSHTCAHCKA